jgi:hypothetical protein
MSIQSLVKAFVYGVLGWAIPGTVTAILFLGRHEPVGGANMLGGGALWLLVLGPPGCAVAGWLTARSGSGPERFWSGLAGVITAYGVVLVVDDMVRVVSLGSIAPLLGIPLLLGYGIGAAIRAFIRRARRESGNTITWFRQHPTLSRIALLLVAAIVAVPSVLATASYLIRSDPSRAEAVLARLTFPDEWELMEAEVHRELLNTSSVTRYYLARGDPQSVTGQARDMLEAAGFTPDDRSGLPACSSSLDRPPPTPLCFVSVAQPDGLLYMQWLVWDRQGGALITDARWFAESSVDQMLVRVTVVY